MKVGWFPAPLVLGWALASPAAVAADGDCPQVIDKDPAFAAMVALAIAHGPTAGGPAGTVDCKPGTMLQIQPAGDHGLTVTLEIDAKTVGKRQLEFAAEPKPFDAAEAVALAYREMAAALTKDGSAPPTPPISPRARPGTDDRPKRAARPAIAKETPADDEPAAPAPPSPSPVPAIAQPVKVPPTPAPAILAHRPWSLAVAPTVVFPERRPERIGATVDLGRDLGSWWVTHVAATLAPMRLGSRPNQKNVRLYSVGLGAGPQLNLRRFHAALLGGVSLLVATAGSIDSTVGVFGDVDLSFDVTSRLRLGVNAGWTIAPARRQEPCPSDTTPTLVPPAIVRTTLSLGFLF